MANVCITSVCNRSCSYCFSMHESGVPATMELELFRRCLAFLDRSGIDQVRILGGEPTLHPQFEEIIGLAMQTGRKILLFTNGVMPDKTLELLCGLPPERLGVMVNVTPRDGARRAETERQRAVLKKLGGRAKLSFTLYRPDLALDVLCDLVNEAGTERRVRLGLALPCFGGDNEWLHPRSYGHVGATIVDFAERAFRQRVYLGLDCGFVPCMFGEEGLQKLKRCRADLNWNCSPILDLDPAGRVYSCFPLAQRMRTALDGQTAGELRKRFEAESAPFRESGIYRECSQCEWKRAGVCPGGCLSATLRRFRPARQCGQNGSCHV